MPTSGSSKLDWLLEAGARVRNANGSLPQLRESCRTSLSFKQPVDSDSMRQLRLLDDYLHSYWQSNWSLCSWHLSKSISRTNWLAKFKRVFVVRQTPSSAWIRSSKSIFSHSPIISPVCPSNPPEGYEDARMGIYPKRSPTPPVQYPPLQTEPN